MASIKISRIQPFEWLPSIDFSVWSDEAPPMLLSAGCNRLPVRRTTDSSDSTGSSSRDG